MKLKSFCTAKETINKTKRQPTEWEKSICKRSNQPGINLQIIQTAHAAQCQKKKKQTNKKHPIKKWAEELNRHFSKEDRQMAKKHM